MNYRPLKMRPCYKEALWGGERLKAEYGKSDAPAVTAESWELACHPDGCSTVAEGPYAGRTLAELGALDHDGFWGTACGPDFPLMVKLIDAKKDLSIQVHPSQADALPGEQGKAEMWYIVDCAPQASIYFGFSQRITPAELLRRARDGSICAVLNRVPVARGDVFCIRPGTVHAIGAGILIAEIQQNANTTFRLYDYQRRDANGDLRPLHLERAAQVLSYEPLIPQECRSNLGIACPAYTLTGMFTGPYFHAWCVQVQTAVQLACVHGSFQHLLCVEGAGVLCADGAEYSYRKGDSFFIPAALPAYRLEGASRVLLSHL